MKHLQNNLRPVAEHRSCILLIPISLSDLLQRNAQLQACILPFQMKLAINVSSVILTDIGGLYDWSQ